MYRDMLKSLKVNFIPVKEEVKLRLIHFTEHENEKALSDMSGNASYQRRTADRLNLPIVFIPGWISHLKGWLKFLPALTQNADVYYLETREKPGSQLDDSIYRQKGSFSIENHAEDIESLIKQLGLKNGEFYLAGPSMGANIILQYLMQGNTLPRAAAVLLPNLNFKIPVWGIPFLYFPASVFYIIKPVIKSYLYIFKSDKDKEKSMLHYIFFGLDAAEPKRLQASAKDMQGYRLPDTLCEIKTPCLLVGSRLDRMHLSSVVKDLSDKISNSEYMEIAASGETHTIMMAQKILDYFKNYE